MAGQENLRAHRLEGQTHESQLPKPEVGQRAYQLINEFKQAIKHTPEFAQALQELYLTRVSPDEFDVEKHGNPFDYDIHFTRSDYEYKVKYKATRLREELSVAKFALDHRKSDWDAETVTLVAYINKESRQIDDGGIAHGKFGHYGKMDLPNPNTATSIQRVEEFLATSFNPTEKIVFSTV